VSICAPLSLEVFLLHGGRNIRVTRLGVDYCVPFSVAECSLTCVWNSWGSVIEDFTKCGELKNENSRAGLRPERWHALKFTPDRSSVDERRAVSDVCPFYANIRPGSVRVEGWRMLVFVGRRVPSQFQASPKWMQARQRLMAENPSKYENNLPFPWLGEAGMLSEYPFVCSIVLSELEDDWLDRFDKGLQRGNNSSALLEHRDGGVDLCRTLISSALSRALSLDLVHVYGECERLDPATLMTAVNQTKVT
jgi:hypothetical protein